MMKERLRILVIAPYESMRALIRRTALDYPQLDITTLVGDLEAGVAAAQKNFHADYDVLISRGGTALLLQEKVELPVVEIPITEYDIRRALRVAENVSDSFAVIGYPNVTESVRGLSGLLTATPRLFTIHGHEETENAVRQAWEEGFRVILCDNAATNIAKSLGLKAVLLTSGQDSIRQAIDHALLLCRSIHNLQAENHFLREIIRGQAMDTVVFDENKSLYFSTLDSDDSPAVLEMLRGEIENCDPGSTNRIVKSLGGMLYSIKAQHFIIESHSFVTFYFSRSKTPFVSNKSGIRYFTRQQAQDEFNNGIYSITGDLADLEDKIAQINLSTRPVMLSGEEGSGKVPVAFLIYIRSNWNNRPMVTINCSLLNEKTWEYLQSNHNSPFAQSQTTIFLSDLDALTPEMQKLLLAMCIDMDVPRRNRVIFSCVSSPSGGILEAAHLFMDNLNCLSLCLPPLRSQADRIPGLINLYLSQLDIAQAQEIAFMEPEAVRLMRDFPWPHNYAQFKRVMQELATITTTPVIQTADVERLLSLEQTSPVTGDASGSPERFDLDRPLDDITRDIVQRTLDRCDGNQSAAAKKLGISRTTLWRYCKNQNE